MEQIRKDFLTPPATFRGAPFWSWNDRLQVDELVRQVQDMKAHGMGGFFMHSREGLETPYMGPEWMECIRQTVQAARQAGMYAWLYDEDRWPSGFAGGLVPARGGDAFRAKILSVEECSSLPPDADEALALFAAVIDGSEIRAARRLTSAQEQLQPGEVALIFRREISGPSEWFNDDAYADNLNPDSVAAFLDITYEAYRKEVGEEFGRAVPGIFTDEPNIFSHHSPAGRRALPWTDGLVEMFRERRGWDLLDGLPWLFYDGEPAARVRHDFWYTISQRFTEAYSRQLGEWCEANGLAFTGHYLNEAEMGHGILRGGAIMPHYRYQQVPGIDMLTEQNHEFITIKQCSSVANQFGRRRVLSETYGCSGWEFTFEGQKWNGDWQYVLGVNLRCQHLALYSLRGCRKRDYPPSFNYNTTWWEYNGVVEDYFARLGSILSRGHAVRDVLMIHPVSTGWMMLGEGEERVQQVNAFGERLNTFVQAQLATHYDFDFGDEQIMATDGIVEGNQIGVGRARYRVVVIPPETRTLLPSTVALLTRFLDAGGAVLGFEPLPDCVGAVSDPHLAKLWQKPGVTVLKTPAQLNRALEALLPRRILLVTPQGQQAARLLTMQRKMEEGMAFFVVNNDRHQSYRVSVALEAGEFVEGCLEEWDALTGETRPVEATLRDGMFHFEAEFAPAGSRLYMISRSPAGATRPGEGARRGDVRQVQTPARVCYAGPSFEFSRTDPNLLTLDFCQWRVKGEAWSELMQVWQAQDELRRRLGMRSIYYNGLPQRYRWALNPHPGDGTPMEMRFTFKVEVVPQKPVYLLLERAELFEIMLNGQPVSASSVGWYLDRAFKKVLLPALQKGDNELVISCSYTQSMELEDCYLLGDFGVSLDRVMVAEPERLHTGDWTAQGYPHYAGGMIYHARVEFSPGERVFLHLGPFSGVHVVVHVNDQKVGHIPWRAANGLELTRFLQPGENRVGIEVVSSPRNMLGPLHRAPEHEPWTDWRSFRRTDESFTPDYVFWPWGLTGQVRFIVQRS
ncbi:hypothetical protein ATHL_00065 [Anaerolinea thermolimosa]|uniref:glycosyl hydrolase n=1 Tax=Anaerolinea thermolimosa TaxID=229919 RepID=UPI000781BA01|nr:glycosyl hydrolase [Anaerolinea thermolimosa]GAP05235.1 hypothetical protein ATHL_00065 [Anaerolinea thermolimosa]